MWNTYHPSLLKYSDNLIIFPEGTIALRYPQFKIFFCISPNRQLLFFIPPARSNLLTCNLWDMYLYHIFNLAQIFLSFSSHIPSPQDHLCPFHSRQNSPFSCHLELTALFTPLFLTWMTSLFTEIQSSSYLIMFI